MAGRPVARLTPGAKRKALLPVRLDALKRPGVAPAASVLELVRPGRSCELGFDVADPAVESQDVALGVADPAVESLDVVLDLRDPKGHAVGADLLVRDVRVVVRVTLAVSTNDGACPARRP